MVTAVSCGQGFTFRRNESTRMQAYTSASPARVLKRHSALSECGAVRDDENPRTAARFVRGDCREMVGGLPARDLAHRCNCRAEVFES
jgi:hypothetical protein